MLNVRKELHKSVNKVSKRRNNETKDETFKKPFIVLICASFISFYHSLFTFNLIPTLIFCQEIYR